MLKKRKYYKIPKMHLAFLKPSFLQKRKIIKLKDILDIKEFYITSSKHLTVIVIYLIFRFLYCNNTTTSTLFGLVK